MSKSKMVVADLFEKDIRRKLNGVIKVEQDDEDAVYTELDEYVITKESLKHLDKFFENFSDSLKEPTEDIGVWVSGFFGSGKSHFIKILSYLLENRTVKGKSAIDFFKKKIENAMLMSTIEKAVSTGTRDVILFNIDAKAYTGDHKKDLIVEIFMRAFNQKRGLCEEFWVADLEEDLIKKGIYDKFRTHFKTINGSEWEATRSKIDFCSDDLIQALVESGHQSEEAAKKMFDINTSREYPLNIEKFAEKIRDYCKEKGKDHQVLFLVDEMGQYIGDNSELMLNLQTIVEELGIRGKGCSWVIVTSQADIDTALKDKVKGQDFSKIQGRFYTRLSLSSANVDEVIKRRILEKKEEYQKTLSSYYTEKRTVIKNLITFSPQGPEMKLFKNEDDFTEVYPFVPYQFKLLQDVFDQIRQTGYSGKHLAKGERSLLGAFKEACEKHAGDELGMLVPFNDFYPTIENFLDPIIKRTISQAEGNSELEKDDCEVLKILFMIRHVKLITTTLDNITVLSVDHIEQDKAELRDRVKASLARLEKQTLIHLTGDTYYFLTNAEQEINQAIKQMDIDGHKVQDIIYDTIFSGSGVCPDKIDHYRFNKQVDDRKGKTSDADMTIKFLTPDSDEYFKSGQTSVNGEMVSDIDTRDMLLFKFSEDATFIKQIKESLRINKYMTQNASTKNEPAIENIMREKKYETDKLEASSKDLIMVGIGSAQVFVDGKEVKLDSKDPKERIKEGLRKLIDNVYKKRGYVTKDYESEEDILKILKADDLEKYGAGTSSINSAALKEVLDFINTKHEMDSKIVLSDLISKFSSKPYGWRGNTISGLIACLFVLENIELRYQNSPITRDFDKGPIVRYLTKKSDQDKIVIKLRQKASEETIKKAKSIISGWFGRDDIPEKESEVQKFASQLISEELVKIRGFKEKYDEVPQYPGGDALEDYLDLLILLDSKKGTEEFFEALITKEPTIEELIEAMEPIISFFGGKQVSIFRESLTVIESFKRSSQYLDGETRGMISQIEEILKADYPYSRIKELPPLKAKITESVNAKLEELRTRVYNEIEIAEKDTAMELKAYPSLESEFKNSMKNLFDEVTVLISQSTELSLIESQLNRIKDIRRVAFDKIADEVQRIAEEDGKKVTEKPTQVIDVPSEFRYEKTIESDKDLDEYLAQLKKTLKDILKNKKIKVS